jgi:hypothetical protein
MSTETEALHKDRVDLVKRLFAIAISVGFAVRVVKLDTDGWPGCVEWEQIARLFTGMIVVIYCWDWYHRDIERKKYKYIGRFILDVASAFVYMVLLYSADRGSVWSFSLFLIFLLFVFWDVVAVWERPDRFGLTSETGQPAVTDQPEVTGQPPVTNQRQGSAAIWSAFIEIWTVYCNGWKNPSALNRGPFVNFCWMLYFFGIWTLGKHPLATSTAACNSTTLIQVLSSCSFVIAGILVLRCDGYAKETYYKQWNRIRIAVIIGSLFVYSVVIPFIIWVV